MSEFINGIPANAVYVVVDGQTGRTVYRTTYKYRNRARRFADRKDAEYGAVRFVARLLDVLTLQPH